MTTIQTYRGIVRQGHIELTQPTQLAEGSQVYVVATDESQDRPLLNPHIARQKANGWLVTYVGSVLAQQPQLQQFEDRLAWNFKTYLASQGHPLRGPVGNVLVDAYSGEILMTEEDAETIINNASIIASSISSSSN